MSTIPISLQCIYAPKKCPYPGVRHHLIERLSNFIRKADGTLWVSEAAKFIDFADLLKEYALLKATGYCCEFEISENPWNLWIIDEFGNYHFVAGGTLSFTETFLETIEEIAKAVKPLLQRCEERWEKQIKFIEEVTRKGSFLSNYYIPMRPTECELKDLAIEIVKSIVSSGLLEWMTNLRKYAREEYEKAR